MQPAYSIKSAEFAGSSADVNKCPKPEIPEYAFIGRSNVGKSSLINMLCEKKALAKVSKKPGKTKLINHFIIKPNLSGNKASKATSQAEDPGGAWYLVDLPGYGYAGVSKAEKEGWKKWFINYFVKRENLMCTFVLLDSRLAPQQIDIEFMRWLGSGNVPFSMVFTKADKLSMNQVIRNISIFKKEMLKWWQELPHIFITSSLNRKGRDELLWFINQSNKSWKNKF